MVARLQLEGAASGLTSRLNDARALIGLVRNKIFLVTSMAGQGKTNFVCDLVENQFRLFEIPSLFIPARQLNGFALALYDRKDRTIHAGDRIRWTANDHERGLLNADRATVTAIGKGQVEIETSSGMKLSLAQGDPMLARVDLAYAYNAHMAQGMTTDRAIVVMESRDTKLLTRQNFLVLVTRVRDELTVYVDKADRTRAKLELQSGEKRSALQAIGEVEKEPEHERTRVKPFEIGI